MIRFDTIDKKPKLWNVAIATGILAAAAAAMLLLGLENRPIVFSIVFDLYYAAVLAMLIRAFIRQLRYNPYSYNTIFYMGFALFLAHVLVLSVILSARLLMYPESYSLETIVYSALNSAKVYMLITFPFILVFSAALCVSNLSLIRHEGFRPVNALGVILAVILLAGEFFLYRFDMYATGSQREVMIHDLIVNLFASVYLYFECMLLGVIVAGSLTARYEPQPDKDFMIILGCRIRGDGTPTPLLRGRLDRALAFAEKQKSASGKELTFVVSGGKGADEPISESASMKRYLLEHGVPGERIIEEDGSTDTLENMRLSKAKIQAVDPNGKVAFSTTNYHVFRSGLCARRVKMRAVGVGAKTKWYFWPNAAVREFIGLLTAHKLKQALIFGGMLVFYAALTLYVYR